MDQRIQLTLTVEEVRSLQRGIVPEYLRLHLFWLPFCKHCGSLKTYEDQNSCHCGSSEFLKWLPLENDK
jgi:hypothetical protein